MTKKSQLYQVEAFLSELGEIFHSPFRSSSLSPEHVSRLGFEIENTLSELRKILLAPPRLNAAGFTSLSEGIRAAAVEQASQVRSQIDAAVSDCEKLRKDIERVQAERQAFNSQSDVIESRRKVGELNQQIEKLQGECAHASLLELKLLGLCQLNGIDPTRELTGGVAAATRGEALWMEYQSLKASSPGEASAFLRKHESELRRYSASLPASGETK